ncbi:MAG: hypothetical protein JO189_18260 [Deltaproteobacteria bacterium]|nr:hypothetical protein [Deltaproteobacteria bacterium]
MLLIVHQSLPEGNRRPGLFALMVAQTALSGPQLYILGSAWVYHEPVLWSAAMGAAFNLAIIRAAFGGKSFRTKDLVFLATFAGLALNTRPTVGIALFLSTMLLIIWEAWRRHAPDSTEWKLSRKWILLRAKISVLAGDTRILLPISMMSMLAIVVGVINFGRWGNPFTFADFYLRIMSTWIGLRCFVITENSARVASGSERSITRLAFSIS